MVVRYCLSPGANRIYSRGQDHLRTGPESISAARNLGCYVRSDHNNGLYLGSGGLRMPDVHGRETSRLDAYVQGNRQLLALAIAAKA